MEIRRIDPLNDLGPLLLTVEKPARYAGGEFGRLCEPRYAQENTALKTVIAFPDLYEIGMSNQALRILYNGLNRMDGILCDRAFAPAPDFEELLRSRDLPLYGLDTGISLKSTDLLMFTLGYELGITGIFSMLDISGIPLRSQDRGDDDPVVIMGGPCVSNPLPYSAFVDAFWIGEAEAGFFDLVRELADIKKTGGNRQAIFDRLTAHPSVWARGKGRAIRAVDGEFPKGKSPAVFPVPSMKVVHQHGAVEIMRGCPNGCRFCHAGYWYRPMRQKSASLVEKETEAFVRLGGYREISLSSLSSGDYQYLDSLIETLNNKYGEAHVSFQLPSLRVSTFSLNLLDKISQVRKSGLTFAVETPKDFWQMAINKEVAGEDVVSILREARRRGWRGAKFYFMLGLPLENCLPRQDGTDTPKNFKSEEEEIVAFVENIARQTGMHFNINVGTFVPKPHTPFQWVGQMGREEAIKKLNYIRDRLKSKGHKVGIQDPMISVIEGIASRGDERAGDIFEEAYRSGCRLDSWTEYLKRDVWEELLKKHERLVNQILSKKEPAQSLPWSCISSGISGNYFSIELDKSRAGEITLPCTETENCTKFCGVCNNFLCIMRNIIRGNVDSSGMFQNSVDGTSMHNEKSELPPGKNSSGNSDIVSMPAPVQRTKIADPDTYRINFSFSKKGSAVFQPHLGLLEIFSMAFIRADIPVLYSQGFNPLPRLDIASPLSLGISADREIATIDTKGFFNAGQFRIALNDFLPEGLTVVEAMNVRIPSGGKKHSVSSMLWGYVYAGENGSLDMVKAVEEKEYRISRAASIISGIESFVRPSTSDGKKTSGQLNSVRNSADLLMTKNFYHLQRLSVLARPIETPAETDGNKADKEEPADKSGVSYFEVYRKLYSD